MNAQRKATPITQVELQAAIRRFQQAGGIIRKLPAQPTREPLSVTVKWGLLIALLDSAT
jgi:hypothetical protein